MARPKKADTCDMLRIVDSFYETHGDVTKLKFKSLENHATSLGLDIKEYDFRRSEAVKLRVAELSKLRETLGLSFAYKTLDTDALINTNTTRQALKAALTELDCSWRDIYERAVSLSAENTALLSKNYSIMRDADHLRAENAKLQDAFSEQRRKSAELLVENRYLKSALEDWLFPEVANEILKQEGMLENTASNVTDAAIEELVDLSALVGIDQIVAADGERITKAQELLDRMRVQVSGGSINAR